MKKNRSPTKAQRDAQEKNWLKFRIKGIESVFSSRNIEVLRSIIPEEYHYIIVSIITDLDKLLYIMEEK